MKSSQTTAARKLWQQCQVLIWQGKCARCGSTRLDHLCGHHIISKGSHPHLQYLLHTGVLVCTVCHQSLGSMGQASQMDWLKAIAHAQHEWLLINRVFKPQVKGKYYMTYVVQGLKMAQLQLEHGDYMASAVRLEHDDKALRY